MLKRIVEYRRTQSFGNYENETIGLTREVSEDETSSATLEELRSWVDGELAKRSEQRGDATNLEDDINNLRRTKRELTTNIAEAEKKWLKIVEFGKRHGIEFAEEELPF